MRITDIKDPATLQQLYKVMAWFARPGTGVYSLRFAVTHNGLIVSKNYEHWVLIKGVSAEDMQRL